MNFIFPFFLVSFVLIDEGLGMSLVFGRPGECIYPIASGFLDISPQYCAQYFSGNFDPNLGCPIDYCRVPYKGPVTEGRVWTYCGNTEKIENLPGIFHEIHTRATYCYNLEGLLNDNKLFKETNGCELRMCVYDGSDVSNIKGIMIAGHVTRFCTSNKNPKLGFMKISKVICDKLGNYGKTVNDDTQNPHEKIICRLNFCSNDDETWKMIPTYGWGR